MDVGTVLCRNPQLNDLWPQARPLPAFQPWRPPDLPAASKAFEGTQPVFRQSPPILSRSNRTVLAPIAVPRPP